MAHVAERTFCVRSSLYLVCDKAMTHPLDKNALEKAAQSSHIGMQNYPYVSKGEIWSWADTEFVSEGTRNYWRKIASIAISAYLDAMVESGRAKRGLVDTDIENGKVWEAMSFGGKYEPGGFPCLILKFGDE